LGHLYESYIEEYRRRTEKYMVDNGLLLGDISSVTETDILVEDLLDSLGVTRICCRVRLMSHKNN
jgi:DNA-directed RNA polymerase subunit N (RpoN/RPB10)